MKGRSNVEVFLWERNEVGDSALKRRQEEAGDLEERKSVTWSLGLATWMFLGRQHGHFVLTW